MQCGEYNKNHNHNNNNNAGLNSLTGHKNYKKNKYHKIILLTSTNTHFQFEI